MQTDHLGPPSRQYIPQELQLFLSTESILMAPFTAVMKMNHDLFSAQLTRQGFHPYNWTALPSKPGGTSKLFSGNHLWYMPPFSLCSSTTWKTASWHKWKTLLRLCADKQYGRWRGNARTCASTDYFISRDGPSVSSSNYLMSNRSVAMRSQTGIPSVLLLGALSSKPPNRETAMNT